MTTRVDGDFAEFVAARWPELTSVAHLTLLDTDRASTVTADALARLNRGWRDVVDAGRPGEQARAAVLHAALTAAPTPTPASSPGTHLTNRSDLSHGTLRGEALRGEALRGGDAADTDTDDPVIAALVDAIRTAPPFQRALLATHHLWDLDPDAVSHLLQQTPARGRAARDTDAATLTDHAASLDARLTAAHDAAHLAQGRDPSPWALERDVSTAIDHLLRDTHDPPDPAALVATRTTGIRRRTLLTAGATTLALTAAGVAVVRRGIDGTATASTTTPVRLAPDDPLWRSVKRWTPRGPLADDPAVIALALRSGDPRNRLLWAGDIGTQRAVLILAHNSPSDDVDGAYSVEPDVTYSEPFVRVYQGPRGIDPARLTPRLLVTSGIVAAGEGRDGDVVAVTLQPDPERPELTPLVVLARPTVTSGSLSQALSPRADGTIERDWDPLPLEGGVATLTLPTGLPLATKLRVGSWEGQAESFTEIHTAISEGPDPSTSPEWAHRVITALTGIPPGDLTSTVFVDAEIPRGLFEWPPPPDAVPARLVSLITTTPAGGVFRTTAYTGDGFRWPLEAAQVFPRENARDPLVVWASDERIGVARFLVAAPGAAQVQLISTSPDGYPVSKVVPTRGQDAVIVPVVNGADAAEYRLVAKDGDERVLFDGVPDNGRYPMDG